MYSSGKENSNTNIFIFYKYDISVWNWSFVLVIFSCFALSERRTLQIIWQQYTANTLKFWDSSQHSTGPKATLGLSQCGGNIAGGSRPRAILISAGTEIKTSKWTVAHCSGASDLYPRLNRQSFVIKTVLLGTFKTTQCRFIKYFPVLNFPYRRESDSKKKIRLMKSFKICVSEVARAKSFKHSVQFSPIFRHNLQNQCRTLTNICSKLKYVKETLLLSF